MIRSNTVFVIGAGASKEAGLPTGDGLKAIIAERLASEREDGIWRVKDDVIGQALLDHANRARSGSTHSFANYNTAAGNMSRAMPLTKSIDNYTEAHKNDEPVQVCGKLAIVRSIMEAERTSLLVSGHRPAPQFAQLEPTWFAHFFKMLSEACVKSEVETLFGNVTFINFNYDHCVEHFLAQAIHAYYGLQENHAETLVARVRHHHPYGTIGLWREERAHLPFGGPAQEHTALLELSQRIRTFSERTAAETELTGLRNAVAEADELVFLGFAFHPMNMDLLQPPDGRSAVRRIYATTYGMSESDARMITGQIRALVPNSFICEDIIQSSLILAPAACGKFLNDFARELAQR